MREEKRIYRNAETSEKALERRLVDKVRERGCVALKMNDVMHCGMPDRLIVMPGGRVMWVEVKSLGKKVTPLQASRIKDLRRLGFPVYVVDSGEMLEEFLQLLDVALQ